MSARLYDYTALSALQACEQEFLFRHGQHLAKPDADDSAHFGQVVHVGVRQRFAGEPLVLGEAWGAHVSERKPYLTQTYAEQVVTMYAKLYGLAAEERTTGTVGGSDVLAE